MLLSLTTCDLDLQFVMVSSPWIVDLSPILFLAFNQCEQLKREEYSSALYVVSVMHTNYNYHRKAVL